MAELNTWHAYLADKPALRDMWARLRVAHPKLQLPNAMPCAGGHMLAWDTEHLHADIDVPDYPYARNAFDAYPAEWFFIDYRTGDFVSGSDARKFIAYMRYLA